MAPLNYCTLYWHRYISVHWNGTVKLLYTVLAPVH